MVKEKVEEDYKKIKEEYKDREIEQICAHGVEAARKFQIYQCCLDWADKLEKIPLLSKDILENHNLIEAVYAAEDPYITANAYILARGIRGFPLTSAFCDTKCVTCQTPTVFEAEFSLILAYSLCTKYM